MLKQLTYNQFVKQLEKGDLKSLEIQPEQNVYMVSGKTKMMKTILQQFYITTIKSLKITNAAQNQDGLKFTVKEEENKAYL